MSRLEKLLFFIVIPIIIIFALSLPSGLPARLPQVELQLSNPYRMDVDIEVKCDWLSEEKKYSLHRFIHVPGKKVTVIRLPNKLNKCELWPKVKFL